MASSSTSTTAINRVKAIQALYQKYYQDERLVKVLGPGKIPEVKEITGKHHVEIGGFQVSECGERIVVVATIDNLLKGAATQAIQVLKG